MTALTLLAEGGTRTVEAREPAAGAPSARPPASRTAYAAAHVVPRTTAENVPGAPADLDWDATLAFRRHVWAHGLGVADAMDTAQRNMGLDWAATAELIRRSAAAAREAGGDLVVGVNTDHVEEPVIGLDEVITAYLRQLEVAEEAGAGVVLMASRHLARAASGAADYERVYGAVLERTGAPVVLHWLGTAFDPALAGYFGTDHEAAVGAVLAIMGAAPGKVRGIKLSLLDAAAEVALRRRLPDGTTMFTGDDYAYVDLIAGDEHGHSDALLGAFAAVAPIAATALRALDDGSEAEYRRLLSPTQDLARTVFEAPTPAYKTGVAFLAWLNGHQPAFQLVGGMHASRSLAHLSRVVGLANAAGALERPDLAARRWHGLLAVNGIAP